MQAEEGAIPPWVAGVLAALLAVAAGFGLAHLSNTLYDSLSYHLFFAARWLQGHAISIVPTPFSDEAQAYAPANGELFFAWLMVPFHGDLLARIGQFPFALLAAATLYATGRRLGAAPGHAIYAPAFFLLSRPILEQTLGANVDLICAALFLTSLYLGIVAVERGGRGDWALWGISVGLYAGTKYLALVYLPVLALGVLVKGFRREMVWAVPGVAMFAMPWYLRNWIIAGSPIYPASFAIGGVRLARGAFDRAAMLNSVFHTSDPRLLFAMAAHGLGPTLFLVWLPIAIIGGLGLLRAGRWLHALLFVTPYLMVPLYWFGLPVNVDSRFLMPAVAPAMIPFAFAFRKGRGWNAGVHSFYATSIVWIIVGAQRELHASVPWFMQGWLSLSGLIKPDFVGWFALCAAVMTGIWFVAARYPGWTLPAMALAILVGATVLAIGGERWCIPSRCEYVDATSPHIRIDLVYGWRWIAEHAHDATVAYTGINLPYPLTGDQLTNRVVYVNIDGNPDWRFHDYDHAVRAGRFRPEPPLLATASGELLPAIFSANGTVEAARPRYERMVGIRDHWIDNLRLENVNFVFIAALTAYEVDNIWHNDRGFPIEDAWASADPQEFHLAYANSLVRIFEVHLAEEAQ